MPDIFGVPNTPNPVGVPTFFDRPRGDIAQETFLTISSSDALASTSLALTAQTRAPLDSSVGITTTSLALTAQTQIPLDTSLGVATTSLAFTPIYVPLETASAVATTSLALTATTQVPLSSSAAVASPTLALTAATQIPLATSGAIATPTVALTASTSVPLDSVAAVATTSLFVTVDPEVPLDSVSAIATTSLAITAKTTIPFDASAGVGSPTLALTAQTTIVFNTAAAPAFRDVGTWAFGVDSATTPQSLTPTKGAATVNGDLMVLVTEGRSITATCATPAGWTLVTGFPVTSGTGSGGRFYVFTRIADGTANDAPTVTWSGLAVGTSGTLIGAGILSYSNATETLDGTVQSSDLSGQTTTTVIPAFTTANPNSMVIGIAMKLLESAGQTSTVATFTERADNSSTNATGHTIEVSDKLQAAAGSSGTATVTWSATTSARALTVSLGLQTVLAAAFAVATPTLALTAPARIPLASVSATVAPTLSLSAQTAIPLNSVAAVTTPTLALSAQTQIPLAASVAVAAPSLTLTAPTVISLDAASVLASPTLALAIPAIVALTSSSAVSNSTLALTAATEIVLVGSDPLVVNPTESFTAFRNPGKGWDVRTFSPVANPATSQDTPLNSLLYTTNIGWADVEPTEGVKDFSCVDTLIGLYKPKHLGFGIRVSGKFPGTAGSGFDVVPIPTWLSAQIATDYYTSPTTLEPDYNDPIYLAAFQSLVTALADRYYNTPPGGEDWTVWVDSIDITGFGNAGDEWWTSYNQGGNWDRQQIAISPTVGAGSTNTPVTFSFDDLTVTKLDSKPTGALNPPTVFRDTYSRSVTGGLGHADDGGPYTMGSTLLPDFSVNGSEAVCVIPTVSGHQVTLGAVYERDVDARIRVKTDQLATDGDLFFDIQVRKDPTSGATNFYRARLTLRNTDHTVRVRLQKVLSGVTTSIGSDTTVAGLTHTADSYIWLRFSCDSLNPTNLKVKAWADGSAEPAGWTISTTDSQTELQADSGDQRFILTKDLVDTFVAAFAADPKPDLYMNCVGVLSNGPANLSERDSYAVRYAVETGSANMFRRTVGSNDQQQDELDFFAEHLDTRSLHGEWASSGGGISWLAGHSGAGSTPTYQGIDHALGWGASYLGWHVNQQTVTAGTIPADLDPVEVPGAASAFNRRLTTGDIATDQLTSLADQTGFTVNSWVAAAALDGTRITFDRTGVGGTSANNTAKIVSVSGSTLTLDGVASQAVTGAYLSRVDNVSATNTEHPLDKLYPSTAETLRDYFQRRSGYRFYISEHQYPERVQLGAPFTLSQTWYQRGVAKLYSKYDLRARLVGATTVTLDTDTRGLNAETWPAGPQGPETIESQFTVPGSTPLDTYELQFAIVDDSGDPAINLAIDGKVTSGLSDPVNDPGWYSVGTLSVVPSSSAQSTSTLALTAQTTIPLGTTSGTASPTLALTATTRISLSSNAAVASPTLALTAPTTIVLGPSAGSVYYDILLQEDGEALLEEDGTVLEEELTTPLLLSAPTQIPLATVAALAADSLALTAPTQVSLSVSAASASNSLTLAASTQITLGAPASQSSTALNLAAAIYISLNNVDADANTTLSVTAQTQVPLDPSDAAASTTIFVNNGGNVVSPLLSHAVAGSSLELTARTTLGLQAATTTATTTLALAAPTQVGLNTSATLATAMLALTASPLVSLNAVATTTNATLRLTAPALPALSSSNAVSVATLDLRIAPQVALATSNAVTTSTLSLRARTVITLGTSSGATSATLAVIAKTRLLLSPVGGLSDTALLVGGVPKVFGTVSATSRATIALTTSSTLDLGQYAIAGRLIPTEPTLVPFGSGSLLFSPTRLILVTRRQRVFTTTQPQHETLVKETRAIVISVTSRNSARLYTTVKEAPLPVPFGTTMVRTVV